MGRVVIMHVDDAPFIRGERLAGGPITRASQLIGDEEKGPWVFVQSLEANLVAPVHSHTQDEVIYVLEGDMKVGKKVLGTGSVLYVEKDTQYGFTVGDSGVRFLNARPGPAMITVAGATRDEYSREEG